MDHLTGADALTSATDVFDYDYPAASGSPSTAPAWYDATTGRANVYLNPANVSEYKGPARGYQLLTAGSITVMTAIGTQRTMVHGAGEGFGVQFTAILNSTSVVRVFW